MNCKTCGSSVNIGEKFCKVCGSKIMEEEQNFMLNNNNNMLNQNVNLVNDEQELIRAYIGKNAEKFRSRGFSWSTFFFGYLYAIYRKMWLLAIAWLVGICILNIFLLTYSYSLAFIINIVISVYFKKMYVNDVKEKVRKIINNNPNKSREELLQICTNKGGTTIIPVIIFLILYFVFVFVVLSVPSNVKDLKYNISSDFKLEKSNQIYRLYEYKESGNVICSIEIAAKEENFSGTVKEYIEEKTGYSIGSSIIPYTINNHTWYMELSNNNKIESYMYIKDNYMYAIKYSTTNINNKVCNAEKKEFIDSLDFRK